MRQMFCFNSIIFCISRNILLMHLCVNMSILFLFMFYEDHMWDKYRLLQSPFSWNKDVLFIIIINIIIIIIISISRPFRWNAYNTNNPNNKNRWADVVYRNLDLISIAISGTFAA